MRWHIRLARSAERDVAAIRAWTRREFGNRQALAYARTLSLAIQALGDGPDATGVRPREDLGPGVLVLHVARKGRRGRHFVVFRVGRAPYIEVLRVLHDSMDLPNQMNPSSP